MDFSLNIWNIALLLGAAQAIFLAGFLFFHPKNQSVNRILAAFLFISALMIASPEIVRQFHAVLPHLIASTFTITFLLGPLIFLYVRRLQAGVKSPFAVNGQKTSKYSRSRLMPFIHFRLVSKTKRQKVRTLGFGPGNGRRICRQVTAVHGCDQAV